MREANFQLLLEQLAKMNTVSTQYRKGYADGVLDLYNLYRFASEVDVVFSDAE